MFNFLSLFSGIGAPEMAMDRLGLDYNLINYCEIDKYASMSYSAIHGTPETKNLGDITKVDTNKLPDIDMIFYGFPCQDISLAGKQKGLFNSDGSKTRSGLFFEALRIIEAKKPKVAIAENVKNLTSKKFAKQFQIVLDSLNDAGYNNYWKVLNAKDYGIPQNRERVFIVSIRKDIDNGQFKFPEPFELKLRLKDMLDDVVDEKYYLSSDKLTSISGWKAQQRPLTQVLGNESICRTLTARGAGEEHSGMILYDDEFEETTDVERMIKVGNTTPSRKSQCNDVYDENGVHPTLCAGTHGNCNSSVLVREATKQGYAEAYEGDSVNLEQPNSRTRRGRVGHGVAQTLTTAPQQGVVYTDTLIKRVCDKAIENGFVRPNDMIDPTYANSRLSEMQNGHIKKKNSLNNQISTTLTTDANNFGVCVDVTGATMRGRNPYNPSDRTPGISTEQRIELRNDKISNCLTTVHKDSLIAEPQVLKETTLRIRKLTPRECFRLMGFSQKNDDGSWDDTAFDKAEKVVSNSQLYKQAGNSIVVDVLEYLIKNVMEVVDMTKTDEKVTVYQGNDLINLAAFKEKEPDLYAEILADYPCESGTYIFRNTNE